MRLTAVVAILLYACCAEAANTVFFDGLLPGQELFDREIVIGAGLVETEKSTSHRCDYLGLPPDDPALGIARR